MAIEIKSKELELIVHGQTVKAKRPSLAQQQAYTEAMHADGEGKNLYTLMINWLEGVGFPTGLAKEVSLDEFQQIGEALSDSKKN